MVIPVPGALLASQSRVRFAICCLIRAAWRELGADFVVGAERTFEPAGDAGFELVEALEVEFAGDVGAGLDEGHVGLVILLLDDRELIGDSLVEDGHLHLPDPFEAPAADGHFDDNAFFDEITRLEFDEEFVLELFPFFLGFAVNDYGFMGSKAVPDGVLGRPRTAFGGDRAFRFGPISFRCFDLRC